MGFSVAPSGGSPSASAEGVGRRMIVMRNLGQILVVAAAVCASSKAYALEHLMKVGEVLVSKDGDTAIQYIELEDVAEPFPNSYRLEVYDAAAAQIGMVALDVPQNVPVRLLVGTAAADAEFGTTRDADLPSTLPADGQACFVNNANVKIYCMAWGCIDTLLIGAKRAPSPPDGMSSQLQGNFTYQVATPTPGAANQAGTMAANCPTDPVDGPVDAGLIDALDPGPIDALDPAHGDGGVGGSDNGDDGGCCQVDGSRSAYGFGVLALGVLLALRRRARR